MARKKTYGKTPDGTLITEELVEQLSREAEAGYDVDEILHRRRGRPPMGSGPASVESVRLDPELQKALGRRARADDESTSSVIRRALRLYLD
jgi:Ribbon-helix-helix protein, copG family